MERDRNLLFGVLAVQLRKITPSQLVDVAAAWVADPSRDLAQRLVDNGVLSAFDRKLLSDFAEQAIQAHSGDAARTLAAFGGQEQVHQTFRGSIVVTKEGNVEVPTMPTPVPQALGEDSVPGVQEPPGRYTEVGEYGRGGMGRVLLVHDEFLGRELAMKELLPTSDAPKGENAEAATPVRLSVPVVARFLQEARITGQLEHPSIVPVYELGYRKDGTLYYTMKLVRGRTLHKALREADTLQKRLELLPHFVDLCQAIAYAHSRGIIHRDIKPGNIMVGEFGETVVLDWGLAKAKGRRDVHADGLAETIRAMNLDQGTGDEQRTQYGQVLGTPIYMPPEQAKGDLDAIDETSDVYSLGAVLYELLTGRPPFSDPSVHRILQQVIHDSPARVRSLEPNVPPELAAICERAMQKDSSSRYPSAKALAEEVQRFLSGALVMAYSYRFGEHLRRFARRHKAILAVTGAALVALSIGGVFSYSRVVRERDRAIEARERETQALEAEQRSREAAEQESYRMAIFLARSYIANEQHDLAWQTLWKSPEKYRNWEWGYYLRLSRPQLVTIGEQKALCIARGGARIVGVSQENTIAAWDTESASLLSTIRDKVAEGDQVAICKDATRVLVISSKDGTAQVFDTGSGKELVRLSEQVAVVDRAAFSPDARRLLTVSGGRRTATVWDIQTGAALKTIEGFPSDYQDLHFEVNGTRIVGVTAGSARKASIWDADSGREIATLDVYWNPAGFWLDPEGTYFATSAADRAGEGAIWDVRSGVKLADVVGLPLEIGPDGKQFLLGYYRWNSVKVWDLDKKADIATLTGHQDAVLDAAFSPDGRRVATASQDQTVRIWDVASGREELTLAGHKGPVLGVAFSPDGERVSTMSLDKTVKIWDAHTGADLKTLPDCALPALRAVFTPSGKHFVTRARDGGAKIWDITARADGVLDFGVGAPGMMRVCGHSSDKKRFLAIYGQEYEDDIVSVCDVSTGFQFILFENWLGGRVNAVLSLDGRSLSIQLPGEEKATRWDVDSGVGREDAPLQEPSGDASVYSPDRKRYVTWSPIESTARVWDSGTFKELVALAGHAAPVVAATFTADGARILTLSQDGTARIWDAEKGTELVALGSDADKLATAVFAEDGGSLITMTTNGVALVSKPMPWRADDLPGSPDTDWKTRAALYEADELKGHMAQTASPQLPCKLVVTTREAVRAALSSLLSAAQALSPGPTGGLRIGVDARANALYMLCLRPGDVIRRVNQVEIGAVEDFRKTVQPFLSTANAAQDERLVLETERHGRIERIEFRLRDVSVIAREYTVPRSVFQELSASIPVFDELRDSAKYQRRRIARPSGLAPEDLDGYCMGVVGTAALTAITHMGLAPNDWIVSLNKTRVTTPDDFATAFQKLLDSIGKNELDVFTVEARRGLFKHLKITVRIAP